MSYRHRLSPLHAARAASACGYCLALAVAALMLDDPLLLGVLVATILAVGAAAGVGPELRRALVLIVPIAAVIIVVNALVSRNGLTVILRLGDLPILGHTDVTLEATVYGGILALRAAALILCGALYTTAVDPDKVLRLFRRVSFHSALTATLATRLVPVLLRDSRRFADAQRCRPGAPPSRIALMRAATAGVFDRALDVAAALEVRGYGSARRAPRAREPWSRHDLAFASCAVAVIGTAVVAKAAGLDSFQAYPSLHWPLGAGAVAAAVILPACALAPLADRTGIGP